MERMIDPADRETVREALLASPTGQRVAQVVAGREGVFVVGGAVRDFLLGRDPLELDLVVEGDAIALAHEIAAALGGSAKVHERFMTAVVELEEGVIDLATARSETYPAPGALPDVSPAGLAVDMERRDFTVNAIAVRFDGSVAMAHPLAFDDLRNGLLRVLHQRSFSDDPTRIWRLARYSARLGFEADPTTARLASEAVAQGVLSTLGSERKGGELARTLADRSAPEALDRLDDLGLLSDVGATGWNRDAVEEACSLLGTAEPTPRLLVACCFGGSDVTEDRLSSLGIGRDLWRIAVAALEIPSISVRLAEGLRPSQIHFLLSGVEPEIVALAGCGDGRGNARLWLDGLCDARPLVDGSDVIAAGLTAGPSVAMALKAAFAAQLDHGIEDRGRLIEVAVESGKAD